MNLIASLNQTTRSIPAAGATLSLTSFFQRYKAQ